MKFTVAVHVGWVSVTTHYEIRVAGILPYEALDDLDTLTVTPQPVHTVIYGTMNQADLKAILARLELLGARVMEIRRLRRP
jgi:hypothetical protein